MEAHMPRTCALQWEKPPQWEAHILQGGVAYLPQPEKASMQQQRPTAAKKKLNKNKYIFFNLRKKKKTSLQIKV